MTAELNSKSVPRAVPTQLRIGSLFSGYGGLDLGVRAAVGGQTAWVSDIEPGPQVVLSERFPGVTNLGDITRVNWDEVEPVDVIEGGSPCQDLSVVGARAGMENGTRSGLWESMRQAVQVLRPKLVVWENVRGALSAGAYCDMGWAQGIVDERTPLQRPAEEKDKPLRALGRVLGDLAALGYDAEWATLRASDIGAPHRRERVFVIAYPRREKPSEWVQGQAVRNNPRVPLLANQVGDLRGGLNPAPVPPGTVLVRTPCAAEAAGGPLHPEVAKARSQTLRLTGQVLAATGNLPDQNGIYKMAWSDFKPAVAWWEQHFGREAPPPTECGPSGRERLSPAFVEWMMGLPAGWVTDAPISFAAKLRALGNGVVPQQAELAVRLLLR